MQPFRLQLSSTTSSSDENDYKKPKKVVTDKSDIISSMFSAAISKNPYETFQPEIFEQKIDSTMNPLSLSTEIVNPQEIEFSNCSQHIAECLLKADDVWIHGPQGSSKHVAVEKYLLTHGKEFTHYYHIQAGDHPADFFKNWMKTMKKIRQDWNHHLPPNYEETIIREEKCLFIVHGINMRHCHYLPALIHKMPNQKWIILSDKQWHERSSRILLDRDTAEKWVLEAGIDQAGKLALLTWFDERNSFSSDPILLPIAINAYKAHGTNFLDSWMDFRKKENQGSFVLFLIKFLQEKGINLDFQNLLFMKNSGIKCTFFQDESIICLLKYHFIQSLDGDYFVLPETVRMEMEKINLNKPADKIATAKSLLKKLQEHVGHEFNDSNQWTIPHILFLFKQFKENCPEELLFPLCSLIWSVGHFYTQVDSAQIGSEELQTGPERAKKISIEARNVIESCINKKHLSNKQQNLFYTESPVRLVNLMNQSHKFLAHLYVNLQYQIGRCYFYLKNPNEASGSKTVLDFAKKLALQINIEGKESLLLKLIDRNGLLFHMNEAKQYKEAIAGYQALLKEEQLFDIVYHNETIKELKPLEDNPFQIVCAEFILLNLTKLEQVEQKEIVGAIEYLNTLRTKEEKAKSPSPRAILMLIKGYLKINKPDLAKNFINELNRSILTKRNQLEVIESEIECALLMNEPEDATQKAQNYRKLAESYYKKGFYKIYEYLDYEWKTFCEKQIRSNNFSLEGLSTTCSYPAGKYTYDQTKALPILTIELHWKGPKNQTRDHFDILFAKHKIPDEKSGKTARIPKEVRRNPLEGKISHTLSNGKTSLVLGDRMYQFLSERGEIPSLLAALKDQETFKNSKFGYGHGYRMLTENSTLAQPVKLENKTEEPFEGFLSSMGTDRDDWKEFATHYTGQKEKFTKCSISTEELCMTANKIKELELFKQVKYFQLNENIKGHQIDGFNHFIKKNVEQFHFSNLSRFACHVIKHIADGEAGNELIFTGADCTFNIDQFQRVAKAYLSNAQQLVQNANWFAIQPDQKNDDAVDYAYYRWKERPEGFHELHVKEEEVRINKKEIKKIKFEIQNIEYSKNDGAQKIAAQKDILNKKDILKKTEEKLKKLELELSGLRLSLGSKAKICFTVLRVEMSPIKKIFFKTYFQGEADLNRIREGQLK